MADQEPQGVAHEEPDEDPNAEPNAEPNAKPQIKIKVPQKDWWKLVREKKIAMGIPVSPTPSELAADNEAEGGSTVLYNVFGRMITVHDGKILKKAGRGVYLGEADALRVAEAGGIPVPHVHGTEITPEGRHRISMECVEGTTLAQLRTDLSHDEKTAYARQLRAILVKMRAIPPPPDGYIGACDGKEIREGRNIVGRHTAPACYGEAAFIQYLFSDVFASMPKAMRGALEDHLTQRAQHRIVLTHGDLAPRNIIVRDGHIVALVDWEDAGWYPEYWEYVKLFHRMAAMENDWASFADDIFPQQYSDELIDHMALSQWQSP